jgi:arsenate reductase-like glutaredoxin family protein
VDFAERDFFKEPFNEAELRELAKKTRLSDLFSWKSPSFKSMGLEQGKLSADDMVRLMLKEPRLIRRPIVEVDGLLVIGGKQEEVEAALG